MLAGALDPNNRSGQHPSSANQPQYAQYHRSGASTVGSQHSRDNSRDNSRRQTPSGSKPPSSGNPYQMVTFSKRAEGQGVASNSEAMKFL